MMRWSALLLFLLAQPPVPPPPLCPPADPAPPPRPPPPVVPPAFDPPPPSGRGLAVDPQAPTASKKSRRALHRIIAPTGRHHACHVDCGAGFFPGLARLPRRLRAGLSQSFKKLTRLAA